MQAEGRAPVGTEMCMQNQRLRRRSADIATATGHGDWPARVHPETNTRESDASCATPSHCDEMRTAQYSPKVSTKHCHDSRIAQTNDSLTVSCLSRLLYNTFGAIRLGSLVLRGPRGLGSQCCIRRSVADQPRSKVGFPLVLYNNSTLLHLYRHPEQIAGPQRRLTKDTNPVP